MHMVGGEGVELRESAANCAAEGVQLLRKGELAEAQTQLLRAQALLERVEELTRHEMVWSDMQREEKKALAASQAEVAGNLGISYRRLKDFGPAIEQLQRALNFHQMRFEDCEGKVSASDLRTLAGASCSVGGVKRLAKGTEVSSWRLAKRWAEVDKSFKTNATPAYVAAQNGHLDVVGFLVESNAKLDARTADGATPLFIASQMGHYGIVQMLLIARSSLDLPNQTGAAALFIAAQNDHRYFWLNPMDVCPKEFQVLPVADMAQVINHQKEGGASALYLASQNGHASVVIHLLTLRARVDQGLTGTLETPLFIACQGGHEAIVAAHLNLASCHLESEAPEAALKHASTAAQLSGQVLTRSPETSLEAPSGAARSGATTSSEPTENDFAMLAVSFHKVAEAQEALKDWGKAVFAHTQAREVVQRSLGPAHPLAQSLAKCRPQVPARPHSPEPRGGLMQVAGRQFARSLTRGRSRSRTEEYFGFERLLPMNTGVEAAETAIKLARRWGYDVKKIPEGEAQVIFASGNFWGRTIAAISTSEDARSQEVFDAWSREVFDADVPKTKDPSSTTGFGPFVPGFINVPYDDPDALEAQLAANSDKVCAFMVEPIQGEAGVVVPQDGYLKRVRELCTKHKVLWIADEVQTGLGRTGKLLACDHDGVRPDILVLGKALSGVQRVREENSRLRGEQLRAGLQKLSEKPGSPIALVRGRGLLNAIVIGEKGEKGSYGDEGRAWELCERMAQHGLLAKPTHGTIIRLAPPLCITAEEVLSVFVFSLGPSNLHFAWQGMLRVRDPWPRVESASPGARGKPFMKTTEALGFELTGYQISERDFPSWPPETSSYEEKERGSAGRPLALDGTPLIASSQKSPDAFLADKASPEPQPLPSSAFGSLGLDRVGTLLAFGSTLDEEGPGRPPGSAFGSLGLDVSSLLAFGSTPAEEVPPPRHTPPHASRPPEDREGRLEPPEAFASLFEHDPLQEEELDEVPTAAKPHLIRRDLQNEEEQPLEERATALPGELVEHEVAHEDEEQVPEPYLLELSSHGMVSQWAPFSSYLGSDLKLTAPLASPPGPLFALPPDSAKRMPEGFIALSVQHHESVSDATAISVGRYFYFDAADYPSFEFTSYPCTCELWRHGRLHWTGQVQLSLGSYGAVDLEDLACAAGRRAPASESRPGDFEVGDLIFVIGFHRNWAVSVGEHTPFEETDRPNRDELGDLGLRIHLDTEVDEAELAKVRPVEKVLEPAGPLDQRLGAANLSRENSLALAGLDEVAEETLENRDGDAGPAVAAVRSSFAWAARRKELLSGGLKSVQNRWEILNL
eukprot:g1003.t1